MNDKYDKQNLRLGKAGLSFFFSLMTKWGLPEEDQARILGLTKEDVSQFKQPLTMSKFNEFSPDMLQRLGLMVGICKDLNTLYPPERITSYINTKNSRFGDLSIMDKLLTGKIDDIKEVRIYLNSCCGSHFL